MFGKFVMVIIAVTGATAGIGMAVSTSDANDAVVTHIVDGDTFDATIDGRHTRIRLLNVDTPETEDPDADVECLGPEAAARLSQMIPVGSTVELAYDDERTDRYDRTLAAVYDSEDRLVNAELAREGLGSAVVVGGNDRFYGEVLAAQEEARNRGFGLYSPDVACTVPGRVAAVAAAVSSGWSSTQPSTPEALDSAARDTLGLVDDATSLRTAFDGPRRGLVWAALSGEDDRTLRASLASTDSSARTLYDSWTSLAARVRESIRVAAEQQAQRDRQAAEEADRAARAVAARPDPVGAAAAPDPEPPAPSTGGGCDANYSPCVPQSARDLDCGDLSGGPFTVIGTDRHRLDADDDGIGCEGKR